MENENIDAYDSSVFSLMESYDQVRFLFNQLKELHYSYHELFKHVVESRNREIQTLQLLEKLLGGQNNVS